jgi:hypothetical protein
MRRFRVPEILLGAMFGLIFGIGVADVTSFQAEQCNGSGREQPAYEQPLNPPIDRRDGDHKPRDYYQRHPISCGIGGVVPAFVDYVDENEGFFVALFTGLLFIATILLWRATDAIWNAGEKQVAVTRSIGEAQVRAYVEISAATLVFSNIAEGVAPSFDVQPFIQIAIRNTGQSPAINFVWNPSIQYFGFGTTTKTLHGELGGSNWREIRGIGIAAGTERTEGGIVTGMQLLKFLQENGCGTSSVMVRLRVQFEFENVFNVRIADEAYFSGMFLRKPGEVIRTPVGNTEWSGQLSRMHKTDDWPGQVSQKT